MKSRISRIVLPILALAGAGYAAYFASEMTHQEPPQATQLALPPDNPYPATVSGSGLIEASSRNIAVGSFLSGIVALVPVQEGQWVNAGTPLFELDRRLALAEWTTAERDVGAGEARVAEAQAELADQEDQLRRTERLKPGVVVSEDRLARVQFAFRTAQARVQAARADVEVARARLHQAQVTLDRLIVRAPVTGRVLKVNVRPGEFVSAAATDDPLVLLGNDRPLHVRVQIDENDVWRLNTASAAEAVVRGNRDIRFPLQFVRIEPWVLPKRSLTGERTERIDTRVLEIVYRFDPGERPVFIGQQVDVFIEADPSLTLPR